MTPFNIPLGSFRQSKPTTPSMEPWSNPNSPKAARRRKRMGSLPQG